MALSKGPERAQRRRNAEKLRNVRHVFLSFLFHSLYGERVYLSTGKTPFSQFVSKEEIASLSPAGEDMITGA